MAYRLSIYGGQAKDPAFYPIAVWKNTNAKTCMCFAYRDAGENLATRSSDSK